MAVTNTQSIQIELDGNAPFEYVVVKQGETGSRIVEITLLENKKEFTIPSGTTAKIKYYKPDGKKVLNSCTISGNVITVTYTEQMLAAAGTGRGEIALYNGSTVLRSATYYTKIVPTVYEENGLISDSEFLDLATTIIETNEATQKAINATASAEAAAETAEDAADTANSAASTANAAAKTAASAASAANAAAENATEAETNAENAAAAANSAAAKATAAETATKIATADAQAATSAGNTAAAAANTAANTANAAAAACENLAKGINSMADDTTGQLYTIGINAGMIYLETVE